VKAYSATLPNSTKPRLSVEFLERFEEHCAVPCLTRSLFGWKL